MHRFVCCSVLQYVTVCCSTLQCVAVCRCQYVAVCCSMPQWPNTYCLTKCIFVYSIVLFVFDIHFWSSAQPNTYCLTKWIGFDVLFPSIFPPYTFIRVVVGPTHTVSPNACGDVKFASVIFFLFFHFLHTHFIRETVVPTPPVIVRREIIFFWYVGFFFLMVYVVYFLDGSLLLFGINSFFVESAQRQRFARRI